LTFVGVALISSPECKIGMKLFRFCDGPDLLDHVLKEAEDASG
jgi:hypothetical protein